MGDYGGEGGGEGFCLAWLIQWHLEQECATPQLMIDLLRCSFQLVNYRQNLSAGCKKVDLLFRAGTDARLLPILETMPTADTHLKISFDACGRRLEIR